MEEIKDTTLPKALWVNISSLHSLNSQLAVLNQLAKLSDHYPFNLPKLTAGFLAGNYNVNINRYKLGGMSTENFIAWLREILELGDNIHDEQIKAAWNALIDFNEPQPGCCFWCPPPLSCQQKFEKILDYAQARDINEIYFISNTNPLNIEKIVSYLKQHFNDLIGDNLKTSEGEDDILISHEDSKIKIYLSLSYNYRTYKSEEQNPIAGTPALMQQLYDKQKDNKEIVAVISQYPADLAEAERLGIAILRGNDFYNGELTQINESTQLLGV